MNLKKLLGFDKDKHNFKTEIIAGLVTFFTMSYILAVNPNIFGNLPNMPTGAVFTATAISAIIGTLVMAFYAKLPFALAPGMGLNAFFVFTVCLTMGYSWQFALTAVFIEGIIFILLTVFNLREMIVQAIPLCLRKSISCGIGLFIAFIGFQNSGFVVDSSATLVKLGSMTSNTVIVFLCGLIITSVLLIKKIKGAMLIGILTATIIGIPFGVTNFRGVIAMPEGISEIAFKFEWDKILSLDMLMVVLTFLFIDMFDTIGTLIGVSQKAGMMDKNGNIPRLKQAFMADSIATTFGALLGASTTTTYVESASGVAQGGRTGLTALVVAGCFAISLFFSPLFLSIPGAATAPILVIVGLMMTSSIKEIDFDDYANSIPSFICIITMPLAYSISDGILIGVISYVLINLCCANFKKITIPMYILAILFILRYIFI